MEDSSGGSDNHLLYMLNPKNLKNKKCKKFFESDEVPQEEIKKLECYIQ